MDLHQIGIDLRNDLRTNLTDPIGRSSVGGGQWVHLDEISDVGKTPSVFIETAPGMMPIGIAGKSAPEKFIVYLTHIVIRAGDRGLNADGTSVKSSTEIANDVAQAIINRWENNGANLTARIENIFLDDIEGYTPLNNKRKSLTLRWLVHTT